PEWFSGPWFFRPERFYLIPGDSPMGLRLPLDSLPYVAKNDFPYVNEQDPWETREPLPMPGEKHAQQFLSSESLLSTGGSARALSHKRRGQGLRGQHLEDIPSDAESQLAPARGQSAPWIVRTALCVEPRNGRLHIFMPPARTLGDYLDLVSAIENTADLLDTP